MNTRIRIGFDFDNTIICYDELFHQALVKRNWDIRRDFPLNKSGIKARLISEDGNDLRWQELQAIVYGDLIVNARPFEHVLDTLDYLSALDFVDLFVVSHKTKNSNYLKEYSLIDKAIDWCEQTRLFQRIPRGNWFFCPTREEKIQKICELNLDLYVDDLEEVLEDKSFPLITKMHFQPQKNGYSEWKFILADLKLFVTFGRNEYSHLRNFLDLPLRSYEVVKRDGNNQIIKIEDSHSKKFCIKKYSALSGYSTIETEFKALGLLYSAGLPVPEPVYQSADGNFALYQQIEPSGEKYQDEEIIRDFSEFLAELSKLSRNSDVLFPDARDTRKVLKDYKGHIERRLSRIKSGLKINPVFSDIDTFINKEFQPLYDLVLKNYETNKKRFNLNDDSPLRQPHRILSPSDFGIHNSIFNEKKKFIFIDFEYFGWDDKAKLMADFLHHAGQSIDFNVRLDIMKEFSRREGEDLEFNRWFLTVLDFVGLEWILIMLNIADPEVLERRLFANPSLDVKELVSQRVTKAFERARLYRANVKSGGPFVTVRAGDAAHWRV